MNKAQVLIKWTGSKRIQAPEIVKKFPDNIKTYYEPFIGGGSILYELLSNDIKVENYECSDLNEVLICLYEKIKVSHEKLFDFYCKNWPFTKDSYYKMREEFNKDHDPLKFFCLLRTCRNGLVRYNLKGKFNSAFHLKRKGIMPEKLKPIMADWSQKIQNVNFSVKSYLDVSTEEDDFLYLDPPYQYTPANKKTGRGEFYFGNIDFKEFWNWLGNQKSSYLLSLNGYKNSEDKTLDVPKDLYDRHVLINNGLNMYDQLNHNRVVAKDSLYIRCKQAI